MTGFMLDTNIVSAFIHNRSEHLDRRIAKTNYDALCVSIITFGETAFGLAKRPGATTLAAAANNLFGKIEILDFDFGAGGTYGTLRALMERRGTPLSPLDMLIAAHALSVGATLVSNDHAFRFVPGLRVEDWTQA
jgi:tRNA(fMet)-specific endonuclease VapC